MRVSDLYSTWYEVVVEYRKTVLGPLVFSMFMDNLRQIMKSPCLIYADDLKLWRIFGEPVDRKQLQGHLEDLG